MKKVIILIVLSLHLFSNTLFLKDYISMISNDLDMIIVISPKIEKEFTILIPDEIDDNTHLKILVQILDKNNLKIDNYDTFFLITKKEKTKKNKKNIYYIKLKNIDYDNIKPFFSKTLNFKHSYISSSKTIIFKSTKDEYLKILEIMKNIDYFPKQLKLRMTIINTNLDKLKERAFELKQTIMLTDTYSYFFNLLAYPFTVTSTLSKNKSKNLNAFIKFMNTNKFSNLVSSPLITLYDNKITKFDVVKNIPYQTSSTKTNSLTQISNISYSYKDVGLKINVLPQIFKNKVYLNLEIISENILDKSSTPTISKVKIKQKILLNKGEIFVLTGINQNESYNTISIVPVLSKIPVLGYLFKTKKQSNINTNLSIILELVSSDQR